SAHSSVLPSGDPRFEPTRSASLDGQAVPRTAARIVDVSQVVWLRKRLGRARLATKCAGILAAVVLGGYSLRLTDPFGGWFPVLVALGVALVVAGVTFRVAGAFGRGSPAAAKVLAVAWVPYTGYCLYQIARLLSESLDEGGDLMNLA